jgi:hypothetical protein
LTVQGDFSKVLVPYGLNYVLNRLR